MRARKVLRIILIAAAALAVIVVVGFLIWTRVAGYSASAEATAVAQSARSSQGWYVFKPAQPTDTALIFYPGGLVDPAAYSPLMKRTAEGGVMTVIVPMPLELAIFGVGSASDVIAAYPGIKHWIIGGHSLGGSMAAEFIKNNPTTVEGLVFLGSYSADSTDLSALPIKVVSIYGTEDGLAAAKVPASVRRLPAGARVVVIDGGNHAQFGDYGAQRGDGTATVGREEQQTLTATAIGQLAAALK